MEKTFSLGSRALLAYSRARSAIFSVQALAFPAIEVFVKRSRPKLPFADLKTFMAFNASLDQLLSDDVRRIADGFYPPEVLAPEGPLRHALRIPELVREGVAATRRRYAKNSQEFDAEARELLKDAPEYYRRNFHFQPDGYLSDKSARLYEHQVEVLFGGGADAMRRLIIEPMKKHFERPGTAKRPVQKSDGSGLRFLEIGAGTGRATRFVRLAFPKARIVACDLSAPYLKRARAELAQFSRVDFLEAAGEALPLQDGLYDACYSVFLHHELPQPARLAVLRETMRVLKPGGFIGLVDSMQVGDRPDMDFALDNFPREYHEPFFKNYVTHPMEDALREVGALDVSSSLGFMSKRASGRKPPA